MDDQTKTLVLLKYEIITSDGNTWFQCNTYPDSVRINWAWRCALDVEHLAKEDYELKLIEISKKYKDGFVTWEELENAYRNLLKIKFTSHSARSSYYAAKCLEFCPSNYTACAASNAAHALSQSPGIRSDSWEEKWKLYISWLIEELCEYESKQNE